MTTYAITAVDGSLVSVGTVVANPLPAGLTARELTPTDVAGLSTGARRWDPATLTTVPTPGWVDPAILDANETTLRDRLSQRIDDLQTLIDYPAVATVPAGAALTTTQLTTVARAMRDAVQQNRAGAQQIAEAVRDLARMVRGDFGELD